jgi:hypothetical protein
MKAAKLSHDNLNGVWVSNLVLVAIKPAKTRENYQNVSFIYL